MRALALAAMAALLAFAAYGQTPEQPRMYPGTDFPGNDLGDLPAASPEDCAARCGADTRCKAFTWRIGERRCQLKWAPSRFDGSLAAVSGVFESRPIVPPQSGGAPPGHPPGQPEVVPPPVVIASGPPPSCSAKGNDVCAGCSVTCSPGQRAACREGEIHSGNVCWTKSSCECQGSGQAPPSVFTPGPDGGANPNRCVEQDRGACRGCSASCPADQTPICTPSIPAPNDTCHSQAWCRCQPR